ncbi:MAG: histidine kinase, partial [Verrucomicrobiota bacterium]
MSSLASMRTSLKSRLLVWFVLLALAPMAVVSWIGYHQASGILIEGAKERLKWDAIYKQRFINNWFDYRFMDLRTHSSNPHNWEFLKLLASGYRGSELSLDAYVGSDDWLALIEGNQDELLSVARNYDYISNLFLIDTEGNLLFSTTRNDDLGTNLISGDYSDTQFAAAYR